MSANDRAGRTATILCNCSGIISGQIAWDKVQDHLAEHPSRPLFRVDDLACGQDNLEALSEWLRAEQPARVVVAACSPREHLETFRGMMRKAGLNPYLLQMVNVREQVSWVTPDPAEATEKAERLVRGALERVQLHTPLAERSVPVQTRVAVIGAGPAGMQAALTLARAGREVVLIERESFLGGLPVRFEELFPHLECGPCLLEPLMGDILHGALSERIRLLDLSEVAQVKGAFGNYILSVQRRPRYVTEQCIGCMECSAACPGRRPDPWNTRGELAAIQVPFSGALPSIPHIDAASCLHLQGGTCDACVQACPVEGAITLDQAPERLEVEVGAIILATGALEKEGVPAAFAGLPDTLSAYAMERLLASNGPTEGRIETPEGRPPASVAIVQCAGSLDPAEAAYCSGTCCQAALKYEHMLHQKEPALPVTRLVREQVAPGLDAAHLAAHGSVPVRYAGPSDLSVEGAGDSRLIRVTSTGATVPAELIVLCRPIVPGAGTPAAAHTFEVGTTPEGFLAPRHGLSAPCTSLRMGIYLAGSARGPGDLREAFASGTAAAGLALSDLVEGRDLAISPERAEVRETDCSGCQTCLPVCPYSALTWDADLRVARVADLLCMSCGTCVAACPSGAITGHGFTRDMLRHELEGVLA